MTLASTVIRNLTRKTELHPSPAWAITPWQQARGFMFQRPGDHALIFLFLPARSVVIHMWFVFGALDILALDGTGKVVALRERLGPWRIWRTQAAVSAIVELPAGVIARSGTRVGDQIVLPRPPMK